MKEAVGGVSLFNIVIVLVLLFTGYISLSINYSKAYNVKNELTNIIKNQGGVCVDTSIPLCNNFAEQIQDYFGEVSYHSNGNCEKDWYGFSRDGRLLEEGAKNAAFCVKGIKLQSNSELPNALYYQVKVFYQLDLPIFSSLFNFSVSGETSRIYEPNECKYQNAEFKWCEVNSK